MYQKGYQWICDNIYVLLKDLILLLIEKYIEVDSPKKVSERSDVFSSI